MMAIAQHPRPSIRGTLPAKERARKAALARWRRVKLKAPEHSGSGGERGMV
jgi:hypothetical protein